MTAERDSQSRKQYFPTSSTDDGIQIDEIEQSLNAESPISHNREPDSNAINEKDRHPPK
jgi:hypothetical protein